MYDWLWRWHGRGLKWQLLVKQEPLTVDPPWTTLQILGICALAGQTKKEKTRWCLSVANIAHQAGIYTVSWVLDDWENLYSPWQDASLFQVTSQLLPEYIICTSGWREAIWIKCLAQGHKCRNWPGWDSNPYFVKYRTWVHRHRPLGHKTLCLLV